MLAPMEGVTDPAFREVMLELHSPEALGGAFTEFVVVSRNEPVPTRVLRRHLGRSDFKTPVGMQLMGPNPDTMAETARRVESLGVVPVLDINFGCPAKGALKSCAGSAALRDPRSMEALVRRITDVVSTIPVTAKIRAGFDNADHVEELARAVEQGGAAMLTIHCRTRAEKYQEQVYWERIGRAVDAISIPVCGNGSIQTHADLERMRRETGCRYAMVGRGALANPWVFSGEVADESQSFEFLCRYVDAMRATGPGVARGLANRVKQLVRYWTAGDTFTETRTAWLRDPDPDHFLERLFREREVRAARISARSTNSSALSADS